MHPALSLAAAAVTAAGLEFSPLPASYLGKWCDQSGTITITDAEITLGGRTCIYSVWVNVGDGEQFMAAADCPGGEDFTDVILWFSQPAEREITLSASWSETDHRERALVRCLPLS